MIINYRKTKPDVLQVLVDLILRAGWNYVSVVNTEGDKKIISFKLENKILFDFFAP